MAFFNHKPTPTAEYRFHQEQLADMDAEIFYKVFLDGVFIGLEKDLDRLSGINALAQVYEVNRLEKTSQRVF